MYEDSVVWRLGIFLNDDLCVLHLFLICDYHYINEKCFDKINQKDHAGQKLTNSELAFISKDKYMPLQLIWMVIVKKM